MSSIVPGYTYTDSEGYTGNLVNASNLHTLVDNSTVSSLLATEFSARIITNAATSTGIQGTPRDHELWWDDTAYHFYHYFDEVWHGSGEGVIAKAGTTLELGEVCYFTGEAIVSPTLTADLHKVYMCGVSVGDVSSGDYGFLMMGGVTPVLMATVCTAGDLITVSDENGWAEPIGDLQAAKCNHDIGIALSNGPVAVGGSTVCTCLVWR